MEKFSTAIIGGGASGLICATRLTPQKGNVIFERLDRVGKKLSATGNGQGNISNEGVEDTPYFSFTKEGALRVQRALARYGKQSFVDYMKELGGLCIQDERGRVYPASRQASSVTDLLRRAVAACGVELRLSTMVKKIQKTDGGFLLTVCTPEGESVCFAKNVVVSAGGKAAKNFGTDGNGYSLVGALGHSLTPLYPSLVQLKTDTRWIKTLKGIRAQDCGITVYEGDEIILSLSGDVIFTEYGVSGDGVFRLSAYIAEKIEKGRVRIALDFAPALDRQALQNFLTKKQRAQGQEELLCGVVNNQIGRAILRRAEEERKPIADLVKAFVLPITGSLGFDYAQVTKGGVAFDEVDDNLQSKKAAGLYLTGEIVDVDGPCGGYNLQWAYASACIAADAINRR